MRFPSCRLLRSPIVQTNESRERMSMESNATIAHQFNQDVWNQGNLGLIDEIVATDYVGHTPDGELLGPQGFRNYVTLTRTQYPDIRFTSEVVAADREIVVSRWTARGTYQGGDVTLPE